MWASRTFPELLHACQTTQLPMSLENVSQRTGKFAVILIERCPFTRVCMCVCCVCVCVSNCVCVYVVYV